MDKEQYRQILETYFKAFQTGDFSQVKFSSEIQFLSPISQSTFDGVEAVVNFVSDVSTRVTEVNILIFFGLMKRALSMFGQCSTPKQLSMIQKV